MLNVVVTGASRGLGLTIAQALAMSGFRVIAVARNQSGLLENAQAELGESLHFRPCDLGKLDSLPGLARGLRKEFGPIYGLVNNVGIGSHGVLATMADSSIEELVRVNMLSPILLTKYLMRSMLSSRAGRIVNISSITATNGTAGAAVYAATKAALEGFTRSLAREIGELDIAVNAVAPGFVATDMTSGMTDQQVERIARRSALGRSITSKDVAHAVVYLMSEHARNITGTVVTVDAGSTA
jgi:3-oxoacyl-[acyl-carrier protein] reductase